MNPRRLRRWVVAASLGLLVVSCIYLFLRFGSITVPAGMDTMSGTHPPGTWCLVEKTPRVLVAKRSVVFIEVEPGQHLLSRVEAIEPDGAIRIRHDMRDSGFLRFEAASYPRSAVIALVLTHFPPESGESFDGR
ncbi:MAG: hypothetical protein QF412_16035 [Planctomycetota bacterium]|jgi:hypothetical protein|nr:hypothetical protein [Planctomycetota bacterium]